MTEIRMTKHAAEKMTTLGLTPSDIAAAFSEPEVSYPNRRYPGQERRIANGLCITVNVETGVVVTLYVHKIETDLRADQTDRDALAYARRRR